MSCPTSHTEVAARAKAAFGALPVTARHAKLAEGTNSGASGKSNATLKTSEHTQ